MISKNKMHDLTKILDVKKKSNDALIALTDSVNIFIKHFFNKLNNQNEKQEIEVSDVLRLIKDNNELNFLMINEIFE